VLVSLLQRPDVVAALPQLRGPAKKIKGGKGCRCSSNRAHARSKAIQEFKAMIRGWSPAQMNQLKKVLKADKIKVYVGKRMREF
jgi:hypothetical protein